METSRSCDTCEWFACGTDRVLGACTSSHLDCKLLGVFDLPGGAHAQVFHLSEAPLQAVCELRDLCTLWHHHDHQLLDSGRCAVLRLELKAPGHSSELCRAMRLPSQDLPCKQYTHYAYTSVYPIHMSVLSPKLARFLDCFSRPACHSAHMTSLSLLSSQGLLSHGQREQRKRCVTACVRSLTGKFSPKDSDSLQP